MGATFQPPPRIDEFQVLRPLGSGAMGQVFLARDTRLDRLVALKFLQRLDGADQEQQRARFAIEARAVARLSHPNVVAVFRSGELGPLPFLASEYIDGVSLDRLPNPVPLQDLLPIAIGLCQGLAAAHQAGVLHRDIKPANAIRAADGQVKLLDFGLAKLAPRALPDVAPDGDPAPPADQATQAPGTVSLPGDVGEPDPALAATGAAPHNGDLPLTVRGALLGTPHYMAPERWQGHEATPQSDVYGLGALLYELACGKRPHHGVSFARLRLIVKDHPVPPLRLAVRLRERRAADALCAIIDRCLQRDPAQRYASAVELLAALQAVPAPSLRPGFRGALMLVLVAAAGAIGTAVHLRPRPAPPPLLPGDMIPLAGRMLMGSDDDNVAEAMKLCTEWEGKRCKRGDFTIEQPLRQVALSPFRIDRLEVSNERFAAWLNRQSDLTLSDTFVLQRGVRLINLHPSAGFGLRRGPAGGPLVQVLPELTRWPVTQVTYHGALAFCASEKKTLPTEAQWEFAAHGEERRAFPWGNLLPRCDGVVYARRPGLPCAHLGRQAAPVGSAAQDRTPAGVHDLGGNVAEWVLDAFVAPYPTCDEPCLNPLVRPADGPPARVVRGGHWGDAVSVRATARAGWPPDVGIEAVGFRCAASP